MKQLLYVVFLCLVMSACAPDPSQPGEEKKSDPAPKPWPVPTPLPEPNTAIDQLSAEQKEAIHSCLWQYRENTEDVEWRWISGAYLMHCVELQIEIKPTDRTKAFELDLVRLSAEYHNEIGELKEMKP